MLPYISWTILHKMYTTIMQNKNMLFHPIYYTLPFVMPRHIPVFIYIIREGFIKYEERILEENFAGEYPDYREKVRRWL